jgi:predicted nucleic acid-binding protein
LRYLAEHRGVLERLHPACGREGLGNSIASTDRLTSRIETFFTVLTDSPESFRQWRRLIVAHEVRGAKVHDARLAAIMQAYGLARILTFNANDFRRYSDITVLDPLSFAP